MEGDGSQPTQATQRALDPRRIGKQNSGFSDEDISDIICLLYPHSAAAKREILRTAESDLTHLVPTQDAAGIETSYEHDGSAADFHVPTSSGDYAIILRLSSLSKNPIQGFQFGRNPSRCDICFLQDPKRRLSNVHFRIYVNRYGVVMLEDQSTNGTFVDNQLLRAKNPNGEHGVRRTLTHGSRVKILMHEEDEDIHFVVRIPRREGDYDSAYTANLVDYFARQHDMMGDADQTVRAGPGGHPDLFSTPKARPPPKQQRSSTGDTIRMDKFPREWRGSDKYNKVGQIGKGAFAVVHKVTSRYDGQPYAAKELEKRRFVKNGVLDQKVDNEMKIMQRVNHPNVVRYIEHFDWENRLLIIIMEFVPGGDLGRLVSDHGSLREPIVKEMASQLLSALGYLHDNNITHRDVKPDNILIQSTTPFLVKLTDFGLSKMVDNEQTFLQTFCGTLLYCAPEVYSEYAEYDDHGFRQPRSRIKRPLPGQRYDHAVDIWSLGGVLFYALTGKPPYPVKNGISYSELLHQIMTTQLGTAPLLEARVSHDAIGFLRSMLNRRPDQRATVSDLMNHPWMGGRWPRQRQDDEQSMDEVVDDELNVSASQLSIQDERALAASRTTHQMFEEVLDDVLDDFEDDSQKENDDHETMGHQATNAVPRLWGEVNISAVGSSGVIPEDRLNISLPGDPPRFDESMETEIRDSVDSRTPSTRHTTSTGVDLFASVANGQSADQLQSLVHNVMSQSLGGSESVIHDVTMHSAGGPSVEGSYFTTSKRKPAHDTSDEFEQPKQKPTFKRLRSEGAMDSFVTTTGTMDEEVHLLAAMPPVKRLESGRQIDGPYDKMAFWENQVFDTWHLRYPEMTESQFRAFNKAAEARKEKFAPGKTPLWDLAMKYFPPTETSPAPQNVNQRGDGRLGSPDTARGLQRDARSLSQMLDVPSTAPVTPRIEQDSLPDTLPPEVTTPPDIAAILSGAEEQEPLAILESAPDSSLSGISIPILDTICSWGRGPENTNIYANRAETKVPKYGVRVLLWKDGYDPSRKPSHKNGRPWERLGNEGEYHFYLSTKATMGIHVNGLHLSPTRPQSAANWIRLQDGDEIVVWGMLDSPDRMKLVFRCLWGGSAQQRSQQGLAVVPAAQAARIEEACQRTERRFRADAARKERLDAAVADMRTRRAGIERERERTSLFVERIAEARAYLASNP